MYPSIKHLNSRAVRLSGFLALCPFVVILHLNVDAHGHAPFRLFALFLKLPQGVSIQYECLYMIHISKTVRVSENFSAKVPVSGTYNDEAGGDLFL